MAEANLTNLMGSSINPIGISDPQITSKIDIEPIPSQVNPTFTEKCELFKMNADNLLLSCLNDLGALWPKQPDEHQI